MTKKLSFLLLVMAVFLFQSAIPCMAEIDKDTAKKIDKLIKKAEDEIKDKKFDKAQEFYTEALALSGEYAPLFFSMGRCQLLQSKPEEGVASLEKALALNPENAELINILTQTLFSLSGQMFQQKNLTKSSEYLEKIINIPNIEAVQKEKYISSLFQLGMNYTNTQNYAKANTALEKLLAISDLLTLHKDKYFKALFQMGINYHVSQKFPKAIESFNKLRGMEGIKPEFLQLYTSATYMLGVALNQTKSYADSTKTMQEYLQLTQNNPADQFAPLAKFIIASNSFDQLEAELAPVKADEKIKNRREEIAKIAKAKTDILPMLNEVIAAKPELEPAYLQLGNYFYYCNDLAKAIETYESLIQKFPSSPDLAGYKTFLEDLKKAKDQK